MPATSEAPKDIVMHLGDMLVAQSPGTRGPATRADIGAAPARQHNKAGRLRDTPIAREWFMTEQFAAAFGRTPGNAPPIPGSYTETGISERNLLYLMLKFMQVEACETILDLAERM